MDFYEDQKGKGAYLYFTKKNKLKCTIQLKKKEKHTDHSTV